MTAAVPTPLGWRIRLPTHRRLRTATLHGAVILAGDLLAMVAALPAAGKGAPWLLLVAIGAATAWSVDGFYGCRLTLSILDDLPRLLNRLFAATGVVVTGATMMGSSHQRLLVTGAVLLAGHIILVRATVYAAIRRARRAGHLTRNALVVGAGDVGTRLARDLLHHPEYGLRVSGFVDDMLPSSYDLPAPLLGQCGALGLCIDITRSDVILLADSHIPQNQAEACRAKGCEVLFVPWLHALQSNVVDDCAWSVPLARLAPSAQHRPSWRMKRLFDIVVSGTALVLLAPVLLATALAVRMEIGRPVIFRQERVGRDGRRFTLLKFRSLPPSLDDKESRTRWNIVNEDQLRRVGRFIRVTSLDELPQLVNVLRGEMSLVGPRPERPFFAERFSREIPHYDRRHRVDVGLTGWAAVHGLRGDTSVAERAHFDNFYIENWSFWTDVKVMIRTIPTLLRRTEPGAVVSTAQPSARADTA